MMNVDLENVAMNIILHAGDARNLLSKAFDYALDGNFEDCQEYLSQSKEAIKKAHIAQTEIITMEANGKVIKPTLLLIHAQDTLMTINSEILNSDKLIQLCKKFYGRRE